MTEIYEAINSKIFCILPKVTDTKPKAIINISDIYAQTKVLDFCK